MVEYVERTPAELLTYMGTDAAKWADEFMRVERDPNSDNLNEGAMIGWFANAIEAGITAGMRATCPHTETGRYGDEPNPLVLCHKCGASHDTASGTWA